MTAIFLLEFDLRVHFRGVPFLRPSVGKMRVRFRTPFHLRLAVWRVNSISYG